MHVEHVEVAGFPSAPNGYGVTSVQHGVPGEGVAGVPGSVVRAHEAVPAEAPGAAVRLVTITTAAAASSA